jgi:hypothetical protein
MKKACPCLAGLAALALVFAAVARPAPASAAPGPLGDPWERELPSPYAHTAIGALLDANEGQVPATGEELVRALNKLGLFAQLPVPFSAVSRDSGLAHPRIIFTLSPSSHPRARQVSAGEWGRETVTFTPDPTPLSNTALDRTQLEGRLFLAANMSPAEWDEEPWMMSLEFISWNSRKLKFDFGVIESAHDGWKVRILDGVRCFSCHKNRGPILGAGPWSNTLHNRTLWTIAEDRVTRPLLRTRRLIDGVDILDVHAGSVDAAVRQGADLLRDRAVFQHLTATAEGRKALVLLVDTILTPGKLAGHDQRIRKALDGLALAPFVRSAHAVHQSALPSALRDFIPPGSVIRGADTWRPNLTGAAVALDEDGRISASNRPNLPAAHVPSNPKAFVRFPPKAVRQPSDAISAVLLARTIGLSEWDRWFLIRKLDQTVEQLQHPALTRTGVVNLILTGPSFADVMAGGGLPDRDNFKERVISGALALLKARKREAFLAHREEYTSTPPRDPDAKPDEEPQVLPSHACLGCHEVRTTGKVTAPTPIPRLAFDPFDAAARDAWLRSADRKRKAEVLGLMLKRLGTDKDMPPEDSTEYELFRQKNPLELNAVKIWLTAELKKVK